MQDLWEKSLACFHPQFVTFRVVREVIFRITGGLIETQGVMYLIVT